VLAYLPRNSTAYSGETWLGGYHPNHQGGLFVFGADNRLLARWASTAEVLEDWRPPSPHMLEDPKGGYWIERSVNQARQRLLVPVPGSAGLKLELFEVAPSALSQSILSLDRSRNTSQVLRREIAPLVLTLLIAMALIIIFAATWIAFYLARGFVTPILRLDEATHRVAGGELGYQVEQDSLGPLERDFRGLVTSFNVMSNQLEEQHRQLVHSADQLQLSHHALGERNHLVELLLENIDAGIVSLSPLGAINALNRSADKMLNLHTSQWQGRHYRVVLSKDLASVLDELMGRLMADPSRAVSQNLALGQGRKELTVEVTLLPLKTGDSTAEGTVIMLKDVTSMQRTQRALAWREVARRVAHEIKNPLTPIQLSAQRLRRKYLEQLGADGEVLDNCTQTIITEVSSLKKMVNEFSQFATLPESKPVLASLNSVIEEVGRLFSNSIPDTVHLRLELPPEVPSFPLDREQMKRVFTNLMDNALAALNGGGTIEVRTSFDSTNRTVTVEVMDDGTGVPVALRSRLFEPYTSSKEGGTGLGLTIVNQIISDHNGYIRYTDRKPKGTIFTIEFRLP
ncbi:MAG: ATP-binding protein, partial [Deltaproteobacteria bacterium]|nr:ATP-binding protein [Deltaproteobacteria bacterium]